MKSVLSAKSSQKEGVLIVPLLSEDLKKLPKIIPAEIAKMVKSFQKSEKFKAKEGEIVSTFLFKKNFTQKLIIIGLGKLNDNFLRTALEIGGKVGKEAKKAKKTSMTIFISEKLKKYLKEFIQGILMGQYKIDSFKSMQKDSLPSLKFLEIIVDKPEKTLKNEINKAELISKAVEFARDLVNAPSNKVDGGYLVEEAQIIASKNGYKLTVLNEKELEKMGFGALLAVNQGSKNKPYCIILEYKGAKDQNEKSIVIVGKGVIFDSGGYNLKPSTHIETMHQDMAGAADVLGIFSVLSSMKIEKNVVGIIPIAENMINESSYKPSDIIKTYSGKTVEVTNTDAEGRLILADAISYGVKNYKPKFLITVATLTGAVSVALGDRFSGIMGNNLELRKSLVKAGKRVDDLLWPLPMHSDFKKKLESKFADLRNVDNGTSRLAGSSKGAAFLEKFVGKAPWCHIDIGGTAYTSDPKPYETHGATAVGLRCLIEFLNSLS